MKILEAESAPNQPFQPPVAPSLPLLWHAELLVLQLSAPGNIQQLQLRMAHGHLSFVLCGYLQSQCHKHTQSKANQKHHNAK